MCQLQAEAGAALIATDPAAPSTSSPGLRHPRVLGLLLGVAALIYLLDRGTKAWALANLEPGVPRDWLGSVLRLHLVFNPGAAFSLGTGVTPVFTIIQASVAVAVLVAARRVASWPWGVALGLLLGGVLGNLTDRLTRPPGVGVGHVVDFLQLPYWPVFNIADSSIVCAAITVALLTARGLSWRQPTGAASHHSTTNAPPPAVRGDDSA